VYVGHGVKVNRFAKNELNLPALYVFVRMQRFMSKNNKKEFSVPLLKIKDTSTHVNPSRPLDLDALLRASKVKVKGKKIA